MKLYEDAVTVNPTDDKQQTKSSSTNALETYIQDIVKHQDIRKFIKNISKPKNTSGKASDGFNLTSDIYVPFRNESGKPSKALLYISGELSKITDDIEDTLRKYASENEKYKDFINANLSTALANPDSVTKQTRDNDNSIKEPDHYYNIGKALVYRSAKFVSKLADSSTKIDQNTFNQLMIDAFNDSENESFLYQFTTIDQKIRVDAAKQTVKQVEHNGKPISDGDEQLGIKPKEDESYYTELLNTYLTESSDNNDVKIPRHVREFSQNAKILMKQVDKVAAQWPRQFKTWVDKYNAKFEQGVADGQKDMRATKDGTAEKKLKDPLTGKEVNGRKAWGTGGPNAFIRDHEYINTLCKGIKNDNQVTIFNLGPKMILGIFDGIEHGGKILQGFKDEFGEAFKSIKQAFKKKDSYKEFNKEIDKDLDNKQYGNANATAQASAVVQFTQLLSLLQNGPIGTVDLENKTFTTAMSNDQTSIEVAMQNLLAAMDKYTETAKRFEENKDVKVNAQQTDAVIKQSDGKSKEKPEEKKSNDSEPDDEEPIMGASYKPTLRNFILTEEDKPKDEKKKESDDTAPAKPTPTEEANSMLKQLSLIKDNFDQTVNVNRLKEVQEALEKFKGSDGDVVRNDKGEKSDFTNLNKIIELYKLLASNDLKFNLDVVSLKDFLDGLKNDLDDFKEIPACENLAVKISENDTKWPAMEAKGELKKTVSGGSRAAELSKKIKEHQDSLIKSKIDTINKYAQECTNDSWLEGYKKTVASLDEAVNMLRKELEDVYGKVPDWFDKYFNQFKTKNYLTKLYMLMSCMTNMRAQLDKMANDNQGEPDSEEGDSSGGETKDNDTAPAENASYKPKMLVRSIYLNEEDKNPQNTASGKNNPTQQNNGSEQWRTKGGKQEAVKHSIKEVLERLAKIDLHNAFLPADPNADVYVKNDPANFTTLQREFALRSTGLSIASPKDGNGISAIMRHILSTVKNQGQKNNDILAKHGCSKLAAIFGEDADQHTDRKDEDLFVLIAAAWGCANCLKTNLSEVEQLLDTKREDSESSQESNGQNGQTDGQNEGGNNANAPQQDASYQYPNVSADSFLNEIYKYIRG